jgi:hypothetical protein
MNYTRKFRIIHVYDSINQNKTNKQTNPTISIFGQRHDFLGGFSYYEIPFPKYPLTLSLTFSSWVIICESSTC